MSKVWYNRKWNGDEKISNASNEYSVQALGTRCSLNLKHGAKVDGCIFADVGVGRAEGQWIKKIIFSIACFTVGQYEIRLFV